MNKRQARYVILSMALVSIGVVYIQHRALEDDGAVIAAIRADPRVEYTHIELWSSIEIKTQYNNPTVYPPMPIVGLWVRGFTAWQYPPDSVEKEDNMMILGLVDNNFNVYIMAKMRGNEVLL